jgi:hypothetical protein
LIIKGGGKSEIMGEIGNRESEIMDEEEMRLRIEHRKSIDEY